MNDLLHLDVILTAAELGGQHEKISRLAKTLGAEQVQAKDGELRYSFPPLKDAAGAIYGLAGPFIEEVHLTVPRVSWRVARPSMECA